MRILLQFIKIGFRNIFRHKRRSIICISAVVISVFFIVLIQSLIGGMKNLVKTTILTYEFGQLNVNTKKYQEKKDYSPMFFPIEFSGKNEDLMQKLNSIKGITTFNRLKSFVVVSDGRVKNGILLGMDIDAERKFHYLNTSKRSDGLIEGRFPSGDNNECVLGYLMARKMGVSPGDSILIKAVSRTLSDEFIKLTVTGLVDWSYAAYDKKLILMDRSRLSQKLNMNGFAQRLTIYVDDERKLNVYKSDVERALRDGDLVVRDWKEESVFFQMIESQEFVYLFIYGIFIILSGFIIVNSIVMIVHERIREIGIMGSLGMSGGEITLLFFIEGVMMSLAGVVVGGILSAVFTFYFSFVPIDLTSFMGSIDMPFANVIYFEFSLRSISFGMLFSLILTGVMTIFPTIRVVRIEPIEAIRG